ncbi:restriction endonuclease subunit S [Vibrio brasiliensis]
MTSAKQLKPASWSYGDLLSFFELKRGHDLPLQNRCDGEYPIIGSNGVTGLHNEAICLSQGVITGRSGTLGKVYFSEKPYWPLNTSLYITDFKGNNPKYCYYFLKHFPLDKFGTGTGVPTLNRNIIHKQKVIFPPLLEQQKIAEVLSTVDEKIDLIDQKIAETEKLKTGLMQKLFSEGIGIQDSDSNWQPHNEFQDSPFGKIPKCWSVDSLGEHTVKVGSGVTPKGGSKAYVDSGIPLIRSQNVLFGKFKLDDVAFITEQQHDKMKGSKLQPRDVLLNITGASIGRCAVLPEDFDEGNVNQHVCIIRTSESIDPDFCGWFLNSNLGQKQIWNLQAGGNREGLNFQQIRSFKIPIFSIEEQCSIVEILSTVSDKLNLLETQKAETQQLKKGLMQKLLTGEWRVPLDNSETA